MATTGTEGQTIYTVNADGASASAGSGAVTVVAGAKDANNVTDYVVDLSADTKASISNADSALQTVVTQIDGVNVKTLSKTDNTANFTTGDNIELTADAGGIKVSTAANVTFTDVTTNNLTTTGVTKLGDNFTVSNAGDVSYSGPITSGDHITNKTYVDGKGTQLTELGLNFTANDATAGIVHRNLGQTLAITGEATTTGAYSGANLKTVTNPTTGTIELQMASELVVDSVTTGDSKVSSDGITIANGAAGSPVSLTKDGLDNGGNTISNVAAGVAPTDAVNMSQLDAVSTTANAGWNLSVNNGANSGNVKPADSVDLNNTDGNIAITKSGNNVTMNLAKDIKVDSVTTGDTVINNDGISINNGTAGKPVSLTKDGLDNGGNTITNVANGVNDTDAANMGQLKDVSANVTNVTNNYQQTLGKEYVNADGSLNEAGRLALTTYNVKGQGQYEHNSVISAVKNMNEQGIKYFHTNDGTANPIVDASNSEDSSASGAYSTAIGYQANGSGTNAVAIGKGAQATGDNSISIGTGNVVSGNGSGAIGDPNTVSGNASYVMGNDNKVTTDNTFVLGNNVTKTVANSVVLGNQSSAEAVHTGSYTYKGANDSKVAGIPVATNGVVSVGAAGAERQIQNVAAGVVSATSTDAINGSQLYHTNQAIDNLETNVSNGGVGPVQYSDSKTPTTPNGGKPSNNMTLVGADKKAPVVLDNVGAGEVSPTSTQAVNGSQLYNALGSGIGKLDERISQVESDAKAGTAAAMAVAGLPQAYLPGKSMMAIGGGVYQGEQGYAVGLSSISDGGSWVIKGSATGNSRGHYGATAAIGYQW